MTVTELMTVLQSLPGELEVTVMDKHGYELEDAAVDVARRLPPGVPFEGFHDWKWEKDSPEGRFSERVVVVY